MSAKPARRSIAIVVPPNAQSLDVSGPLDAFLEATVNHPAGFTTMSGWWPSMPAERSGQAACR
jgi:hypothetical protein